MSRQIHHPSISYRSPPLDPINIYHSNVATAPVGAISINGITYVPAVQALQTATITPLNIQPINGANIINVNHQMASPPATVVPIQVPVINTGTPILYSNPSDGNVSPSASPVSPVIQSPILGATTGTIVVNNNSTSPYNYPRNLSPNLLPLEASPNLYPLSAINHSEISNLSGQPVSPHLFAQPLDNRGEIIQIDDRHMVRQNSGNESNDDDNSNNTNNIEVPEIVLNTCSSVSPNNSPLNQQDNTNTNLAVNYISNDSINNNNNNSNINNNNTNINNNNSNSNSNIQDNSIYYNETPIDTRILRRSVIVDPDDEMYNQMVTYNGLLNESTANHIVDNGQYITYTYAAPGEEMVREPELYYEEIDPDEEAPPPYSDTINFN